MGIAAGLSLIVGAVSTAKQMSEQKKVQKAQKQQRAAQRAIQDVRARQERVRQARAARSQRAELAVGAQATGIAGSSSFQSAQQSIGSQLATSQRVAGQITGLQDQVSFAAQREADAAGRARNISSFAGAAQGLISGFTPEINSIGF